MASDKMQSKLCEEIAKLKTENEKLKTENEKLNKKIRRYEEMLGSMFGAGNMIIQEKERFNKLKEQD